MHGRLTDRDVSVTVETACHHCAAPFTLEIDADMNVRAEPAAAEPVVFVPDVVPFEVEGPDIVDDF